MAGNCVKIRRLNNFLSGYVSRKAADQTDSQVDASQRKFAKPEFAYGLAKGDQTDLQVDSQVAKSRKFHAYHWLMRFYNRLLAINLCRLALGGQTVKNLRRLAYEFELDQSQRKLSQVNASGWPKETQVQNLRRLASSFGQGSTHKNS